MSKSKLGISSFDLNMRFKDKEEAKNVFTNIWGEEIGNKVKSQIIRHNVVVYKY